MLENQRHLFEIPDDVTYLNCSYLSPQLREVTRIGLEAVRLKAAPWNIRPQDFLDESERLRAAFAELVGGDSDGAALIPSVSYGMAIASANLTIESSQSIVTLAEQFPSNVYPWRHLAQTTGARLRTVARPADEDWTAAVLAAIDDRTRIVAVPNCHWTDGTMLDLVRIGTRCREVKSALVVDATQSLGALPLDVRSVRPDFLVAAGYKWLLGPYSIAYLWAAPDRRHGVPIEQNWINRKGADDFARLVDYRDEYAPGARRYDVGERSNFVLVPMALCALRQLLTWSVEAVAETVRQHTRRLAADASRIGYRVAPEPLRGPHMLGLWRPAGLPKALSERLANAKVHVSVRGDAIRVSPHVYTTTADLNRLLDVLAGE